MCVVNTAECLFQAENGRQQLHVAYSICGSEYSPFSLSLWEQLNSISVGGERSFRCFAPFTDNLFYIALFFSTPSLLGRLAVIKCPIDSHRNEKSIYRFEYNKISITFSFFFFVPRLDNTPKLLKMRYARYYLIMNVTKLRVPQATQLFNFDCFINQTLKKFVRKTKQHNQ